MRSLGIYIHLPFCRSKCHYCDFCSLPHPDEALVRAYVDRLCEDIAVRAESCRAHSVDSVYFGGGTPTLLPSAYLVRILETVAAHYHLDKGAEITAECNPSTGDGEGFGQMRRAGFNRLSMGVQSVHPNELRALGRIHNFDAVKETWETARRVGFENMSADVMQGIPEQSVESYLETLRRVLSLSPAHLSSYGLSIEEGTRFGRIADTLVLPDEEASREMYFRGIELLEGAGLFQYEISNFAREGYESRHNLKYWRCEDTLGFGVAAYSCIFGERFGNSRDIAAYLRGEDIVAERERLTLTDGKNEYVMLGLRLNEGISESVFAARFGQSLEDFCGESLSRYLSTGHIQRTAEGYALSPEGTYLSNYILSDLLSL